MQRRIVAGELNARIVLVVSTSPKAGAVSRAEGLGLRCVVVPAAGSRDQEAFSRAVFEQVEAAGADLVCLAGFLYFLAIPSRWVGRVINIHPALLPEFGGKGMYGHHVHEAVIAAGRRESGCTVHYADNEYDHGQIILQKRCSVHPGDTPDALAARVFALECEAYPEAIRLVAAQIAAGGGEAVGR